jgi:hypothetical protein
LAALKARLTPREARELAAALAASVCATMKALVLCLACRGLLRRAFRHPTGGTFPLKVKLVTELRPLYGRVPRAKISRFADRKS